MPTTLTYDALKSAVAGGAAAFRLTLRLEAISPKVFPPTYEGGKYATETRRIGGQELPCVLLDSVPSQANRMELALQEAVDGGEMQLPVLTVNFAATDNPNVPRVTSLQAPHRIADAILRDSYLGKTRFRQSEIGKELDTLSIANATPLLKHAPTCLVFGMWDSTGPRGGLGVKFARAVVSEIIGVNAVGGVKTSSRIDPLNIRANAGLLFKAKDGWTLDEANATKDKGKPVKFGKDGKPSEANHSNIPPSVSAVGSGGFTIDYAEQTTVLSLPALRRLRFPLAGAKSTAAADVAARTYLAALGLLGAVLAVEAGYDLRSRCLLQATTATAWELLGRPGEAPATVVLSKEQALALYAESLAAVRAAGLPVHTEEVPLTPSPDLVTLVKKSMEIAALDTTGEGS